MKKLVYIAVFCLSASFIVLFSTCKTEAPKASLKTDIDSLSYAFGVTGAQGLDSYLANQGYEKSAIDEFYKGFLEGSNLKDKKVIARLEGKMVGKQVMDMYGNINTNTFGPDSDATESLNRTDFISGFLAAAQNKHLRMERDYASVYTQMKSEEIQNKANEHLKVENLAYLLDNKTKPGVTTSASGLQYIVEKETTGPKPTAADVVKVKYRGTDIHGVEFDKNEDAVFSLSGVIQGWTEGIQLMSVGSKYKLFVPYDIGYGERGWPPNIKPYATLIFEVELLEIVNNE